jgi:hypothetical protein
MLGWFEGGIHPQSTARCSNRLATSRLKGLQTTTEEIGGPRKTFCKVRAWSLYVQDGIESDWLGGQAKKAKMHGLAYQADMDIQVTVAEGR